MCVCVCVREREREGGEGGRERQEAMKRHLWPGDIKICSMVVRIMGLSFTSLDLERVMVKVTVCAHLIHYCYLARHCLKEYCHWPHIVRVCVIPSSSLTNISRTLSWQCQWNALQTLYAGNTLWVLSRPSIRSVSLTFMQGHRRVQLILKARYLGKFSFSLVQSLSDD